MRPKTNSPYDPQYRGVEAYALAEAARLGIDEAADMPLPRLIRTVQRRSGELDCFRAEGRDRKEYACPWRPECQRLLAAWLR